MCGVAVTPLQSILVGVLGDFHFQAVRIYPQEELLHGCCMFGVTLRPAGGMCGGQHGHAWLSAPASWGLGPVLMPIYSSRLSFCFSFHMTVFLSCSGFQNGSSRSITRHSELKLFVSYQTSRVT